MYTYIMWIGVAIAVATSALAADGVDFRRVVHQGDVFTVATVDLRVAALDLYGQTGAHPRTFDDLENALARDRRRLVFAMNGGMYDHGHTPTGLHIERGVLQKELNRDGGTGNFFMTPNGVFLVDQVGARVLESSQYEQPVKGVRLATQSGPMLLIDGQVHPAFRPQSTNKLPRNGVCASDAHTVHLAISHKSVRLYDFATLFRDEFTCTNALYLDGVVSAVRGPKWWGPDHGHFGAILAVTEPVD